MRFSLNLSYIGYTFVIQRKLHFAVANNVENVKNVNDTHKFTNVYSLYYISIVGLFTRQCTYS